MAREVGAILDRGHVRTIAQAWRLGSALAGAELSPCWRYRWLLWRIWGAGSVAHFVMLNPSTADAGSDDPTIRRCMRFASRLGHGGVLVTNLYALRSTEPAALKGAYDPVGPYADEYIRQAAVAAAVTICAWGAHAELGRRGRAAEVRELIEGAWAAPMVLGYTAAGHPRHPLYLKADSEPLVWAVNRSDVASDRKRGSHAS